MSAEAEPPSGAQVILDSCVIINLYASRYIGSILETANIRWSITQYTKEHEARRVGSGRLDQPGSEVEPIDLDPLFASGVLRLVNVTGDAEAEAYVRFARDLDDGEAQCGAVALGRGLTVATDDVKATRLFGEHIPPIPTIGTPAILHEWSMRNAIATSALTSAIRDIERRARFRPRAADPLAAWWAQVAA